MFVLVRVVFVLIFCARYQVARKKWTMCVLCRSGNLAVLETASIDNCTGRWSCRTLQHNVNITILHALIKADRFQNCPVVRSTMILCMLHLSMHHPVSV